VSILVSVLQLLLAISLMQVRQHETSFVSVYPLNAIVSICGPLVTQVIKILEEVRFLEVVRNDDVSCQATFTFIACVECLPAIFSFAD